MSLTDTQQPHTGVRVEAARRTVIRLEQIEKYLNAGKDFIDAPAIEMLLADKTVPDSRIVDDIIDKALAIETLTPAETATLMKVREEETYAKMQEAASVIKHKVYDNRVVTFAPLYLSNYCINDCQYCGFRASNRDIQRRKLTLAEIEEEAAALAGKIGHKRLIVVYGEHPCSDVEYIVSTLEAIYGVKVKTRKGWGQIRRCNVNAAPMSIEDLETLKEAGLGTFQVFQETYHRPTYEKVHPGGTVKGDYLWRLYSMHRSMEAGVDDVGLGALFGLYDWRYEVMGLLYHAIELERRFGVGPHTISFPRLEPAHNTPFTQNPEHSVNDEDFARIVTVLRLAVPYTGMILTARENAETRRRVFPLGCTQMDASAKIGIGSYSNEDEQEGRRQQFMLGDTRSLDEVIGELARDGCITSFCTAGYRCGRTGQKIMNLLRSGAEGRFCKLNAVITFREWLDDFASPETMESGEKLIAREIAEVEQTRPEIIQQFMKAYRATQDGQRDIFF